VERRLDMRHAAKSALENVKLGEVVKSPRYSSEPHDLSASRAKRWPYRVSAKVFVTHGQSSPWAAMSRTWPRWLFRYPVSPKKTCDFQTNICLGAPAEAAMTIRKRAAGTGH